MITRIWHGWTIPENADAYEALLKTEIFTGIQQRQIPGFRGIQLLRRNLAGEIEFVTMMRFDSIDAVRAFAGEDYEIAVVPEKARALLSRFDARSQHYEVEIRALIRCHACCYRFVSIVLAQLRPTPDNQCYRYDTTDTATDNRKWDAEELSHRACLDFS